jgi:hypothetical protein
MNARPEPLVRAVEPFQREASPLPLPVAHIPVNPNIHALGRACSLPQTTRQRAANGCSGAQLLVFGTLQPVRHAPAVSNSAPITYYCVGLLLLACPPLMRMSKPPECDAAPMPISRLHRHPVRQSVQAALLPSGIDRVPAPVPAPALALALASRLHRMATALPPAEPVVSLTPPPLCCREKACGAQ